jgi:hypothetical protein
MSAIKNVDAFEKLVGLCSGYGESYDPGRQNLRHQSLNQLLRQAREALQQVHRCVTAYQEATNQREVLFGELKTLAPRVLSELRASGALPQTIRDAQTFVRYAAGHGPRYRAPLQKEGAPEPQRTREARGTDYGSRVGHFDKLLQLLASEEHYRPQQAALRLTSLLAFLERLREANRTVVTATVNWQLARQHRNQVVYRGSGNLVDTARAVKFQLRALFGAQSEAYLAARPIRFTQL